MEFWTVAGFSDTSWNIKAGSPDDARLSFFSGDWNHPVSNWCWTQRMDGKGGKGLEFIIIIIPIIIIIIIIIIYIFIIIIMDHSFIPC